MSDAAARCPFCGSSPSGEEYMATDNMFPDSCRFHYASCARCESMWLLDPPADQGTYYPAEYYSIAANPDFLLGGLVARLAVSHVGRSALLGHGVTAALVGRATRRREVHTLLSIYGAIRRAGLARGEETSFLDVGAGSGLLIYAMSLAGLRVTGVDPFSPASRRFETGAVLIKGEVSQLRGVWDLIMLHHTLEHVPSPVSMLEECASLLATRGRILVRSPTVSSWAWRHYGTSWAQLDAPRHIAIPSRLGIELLAERTGLRVISQVDDSTSFQFWGSEQIQRGISLTESASVMVSPESSPFTKKQLREWNSMATRLNKIGRGDQLAWILEPKRP